MPLVAKPVSRLTEADLLALISDKEPEGKTLEYKRELPGKADGDRKEFLYDASSLANTRGGDLIFGMDEADGLPTRLVGIAGVNPDEEILQLEQMLRSGIRPALNGVESARVDLASGSFAFVMRIPKSWNPPHQVTFQNAFRFYARDTNGKYQIDVEELRSIYAVSASIADRVREFRAERISRIAGGDAPVGLLGNGNLVLHVVPFSAFVPGSAFPLDRAQPNEFPPIMNSQPQHAQMTFDGMLMTSNAAPPPDPQRAYVQVLRTGAVEAVASSIASGQAKDMLILPLLESLVVGFSFRYLTALHRLGVEPPVAILTSLVGIARKRLLTEQVPRDVLPQHMPAVTLERSQMHFVETVVMSMPTDQRDMGKQLRATLNHLANAAGLSVSPSFELVGGLLRATRLKGAPVSPRQRGRQRARRGRADRNTGQRRSPSGGLPTRSRHAGLPAPHVAAATGVFETPVSRRQPGFAATRFPPGFSISRCYATGGATSSARLASLATVSAGNSRCTMTPRRNLRTMLSPMPVRRLISALLTPARCSRSSRMNGERVTGASS